MSAFAPKADKRHPSLYVRFVPKADIRTAAGFLIRSPRRRGRAARRSATTQFDASRGANEYLGYCGAMLAIRTTLPHFSDSAAMKAANSWALSVIGALP